MCILMDMTGNKFLNGGQKYDKVIIPVGSCENHGYHLPFGTDTFVADKIAQYLIKQVPGLLLLPPVNVGVSYHYDYFKFSLTLQPETLISVLKDIINSVVKNGINHIFIINGHDGNIEPIEIAARSMKVQYPNIKIATLDAWWVTAGKLLPPDTFEVWNGLGHAGEGETSMALALFPELVDMSVAKGVVPNLPDNIGIKWLFAELTNVGATGDPTKATQEKGQKMLDVLLKEMVKFFKTMDETGWDYSSPQSSLK